MIVDLFDDLNEFREEVAVPDAEVPAFVEVGDDERQDGNVLLDDV